MYAASVAYTEKMQLYNGLLQPGQQFMPIVLETYGAAHQDFYTLVNMVADRAANEAPDGSCWATPTFVAYWVQRVNTTLWRENAKIVLHIKSSIQGATATSLDQDQLQ